MSSVGHFIAEGVAKAMGVANVKEKDDLFKVPTITQVTHDASPRLLLSTTRAFQSCFSHRTTSLRVPQGTGSGWTGDKKKSKKL